MQRVGCGNTSVNVEHCSLHHLFITPTTMSKLKEFYKWFKNGSYPNYHEIEQKIKELLKEEESILPQDKNGWTPTANEMIEVSDDGVKWEERKYCCPHNTKTFTGYCTYGI